jgi:carboxymethylenebutenolidase
MSDTTPLSVHEPSVSARGGVIVIQEAFGVNDHIEDVCARLADVGYRVVAPHLFHRTGDAVLAYDDFASALPHVAALTPDGILDDVRAAVQYLERAGTPQTRQGIVGFCLGGSVVVAFCARAKLGAAVSFYGGGVHEARFGFEPLADAAPGLKTPWLGLFGDEDHDIPVSDVEDLRRAAAQSTQVTEIVRYPDAGHGFHCDQRESYCAEAAASAWQQSLEWFDRFLSS